MIIFVYIIFVKTCSVPNQEYNIYPTEGELIEITMDKLIQGSNLTYQCEKCSQGISVSNIFENQQLFENKYTFKSVSFHEDKIYALTTEPSINIYLNKNGKMNHNPIQIINISQSQECFSITYTEFYNIIIDCYEHQILFLYYIRNNSLSLIYTSNSSIPNYTKISSIVKNTSTSIIYGQSFAQVNTNDSNLIILNLTILQEHKRQTFIVTDNLQDNAFNFFVSNKESINQTIFIQYYDYINSYVLQENGTLLQVNNISFTHEIINMAYYYSQDEYYQFDRLFLIVLDDDFDYMYFIDVFYCDSFYVETLESKQQRKEVDRLAQIFISQDFIIIYSKFSISILKNEKFNQILFRKQQVYDKQTVIYFDELGEYLYIFGETIIIHKLQIPLLSFSSNESQGKFSIRALEIDGYFQIHLCQVNINFQQVSQSNNNIYPIFIYPQESYINLLQFPFEYWIHSLSGPLIKAISHVSDENLGYFYDNTSYKINSSLQQNYYIAKAFSVNLFQEYQSSNFSILFTVAVNNQNLDIYQLNNKSIVSSIDINYMNTNVTQIEITFVVLNQQVFYIVCLSFGQNIIQVYQYNNHLQMINNLTLQTETFKQFQLLSNSIVLLLNTNEISIIKFDNKSQILFNSKILEDALGQKVHLNLTNIVINQQYQSRVLYINNYNNFIIGYITEQLNFVFISIKNVIFQIENLFVVWNAKNLKNPIYLKQMKSISFDLDQNSISYFSDNQFFYVLHSSTLYVYNPNLPGHSSLYYHYQFEGLYFTSIAINSFAFLCFNQSFYLLSPILLQAFYNKDIHQQFLIQQIFNFTFQSYLDDQNPYNQSNSSLTIINNYLDINLKDSQVNVNKSQSYVVLFKYNISLQGQALYFNITDKDSKLTNNIENPQKKNQRQIYNQIIQYNNSNQKYFMLLNNQGIYNYSQDIPYNFFTTYNQCIASTIQNQTIYALCQDNQSQYYIISINLSNVTSNTVYPNQILNLSNNNYRNNSWIRIQNNKLYIWNDTIYMYNLNQIEQPQQFICKSTQFGFQSIEINLTAGVIIIYIYFKPIHKDQLYYKFAQTNNDSTFTHGDENSILLRSFTQQYFSFDTIPMIQKKYKQIFVMISNSNFNLMVSFLLVINKQNITNSQLIYQSIIQASPPYDKHYFNVSQLPQYNSQLLFFMYSNTQNQTNQTHMIIFYNISNNTSVNIQNPLLYEGGYIFSLNQTLVNDFSFIAQNNSSGNILILLNNGSTLELQLNIFSLNISLGGSSSKNKEYINLTAYNYYNSGQAKINFTIQKDHLFEKTSFYILFGITIIALITSIVVCSFYQKDNIEEEYDSDDEL
ncbi:unnamed protein product [Paramecium pentaurelia]|uniref:Transmembrane protein n=1 Tax=Paramecium pentaurelia TaxID=43138 RepID=A0A8S1YNA4_9CILI|nr:unnamed protein product [Paramecium pentaurelia]